MNIQKAEKEQARSIARLIMMAMTEECCLYYIGTGQTLEDFYNTMTALVESEHSQYSYSNTLVATGDNGDIIGISTSYDGAKLHELREAFINAARKDFGRDFNGMADETQAGELYLDSLAVEPSFRKRGVATALLKATIQKAQGMGLPAVGLLVDKGNPKAEQLYTSIGFKYVNDSTWGGHAMKHLQYKI